MVVASLVMRTHRHMSTHSFIEGTAYLGVVLSVLAGHMGQKPKQGRASGHLVYLSCNCNWASYNRIILPYTEELAAVHYHQKEVPDQKNFRKGPEDNQGEKRQHPIMHP